MPHQIHLNPELMTTTRLLCQTNGRVAIFWTIAFGAKHPPILKPHAHVLRLAYVARIFVRHTFHSSYFAKDNGLVPSERRKPTFPTTAAVRE